MRDPVSSEHWLQYLWEHRLYSQDRLRTADGQSVTVVSSGVLNYDSGPDFTDALIRIGTILFRGDVEVHVHANEWVAHRHHLDARYNAVILHVALRAGALPTLTASGRELPLLLLPPTPQSPCSENPPFSPSRTEPSLLHCPSTPIADPHALVRRFSLLGLQRLERKVVRLEGRLFDLAADSTTSGAHTTRALWEQLLYEGIVEGLGYAKNRDPFRRLARTVMLGDLHRVGLHDHEGIMAALFGAAGLLPSPRHIPEDESRRYVRRLRCRWKELRPNFKASPMDETAWKVFRLRPANLPIARLASLVFLLPELFGPGETQKIVSLFRQPVGSCGVGLFSLWRKFAVRPDEFWTHHLYFGAPRHPYGIALGRQRINDILVNTLFPWLLLYSRKFRQTDIEQSALLTYRTFPPLQRNRVTHQVERFLTRFPLATAQLHQGALEWVRRFCSQQRCVLCPLAHS
jgi:hypothetical protein